jgi:hypothetical protein
LRVDPESASKRAILYSKLKIQRISSGHPMLFVWLQIRSILAVRAESKTAKIAGEMAVATKPVIQESYAFA